MEGRKSGYRAIRTSINRVNRKRRANVSLTRTVVGVIHGQTSVGRTKLDSRWSRRIHTNVVATPIDTMY